jgi:hypothetical protein
MKNSKGAIEIILLGAVFVILASGIYFLWQGKPAENPGTGNADIKACPDDIKSCPGGSSVTRVSPSCDFMACPTPAEGYTIVEYTGEYICLVPKDTGGAVTLECSYGLKLSNGLMYALDLSSIGNIENILLGDQLEVEGTLIPIEAVSSDHMNKYKIEGIIEVITWNKK